MGVEVESIILNLPTLIAKLRPVGCGVITKTQSLPPDRVVGSPNVILDVAGTCDAVVIRQSLT